MLQQFPRSCVSHTFTADSLPALTGADLGNRARSRGTSPELGAHGGARRYQPFRSTDTGGHKLHTVQFPYPGGRLGGPHRWRGNLVATGPAVTCPRARRAVRSRVRDGAGVADEAGEDGTLLWNGCIRTDQPLHDRAARHGEGGAVSARCRASYVMRSLYGQPGPSGTARLAIPDRREPAPVGR
jgi:hypothetical protein